MLSLNSLLAARVEAAAGIDPEMRPATKPQFGHFQSNVALRLAKAEGQPPRAVAERLVGQIDIADVCEPLEIAGPGFINFRIRADVLAATASEIIADPAAGIDRAPEPKTVVVDYSAPNVAKQMHVGHLRSTIIGDCFNRVLTAQGHHVIPQNHVGDWGRQFGMLVEQVLDENLDLGTLDLAGAEELYLRANARLKADEAFADRARDRVVLLQSGDAQTLAIWRRLIELSMQGFNATYGRLGVLLTDADVAGESFYNDLLAPVCDDLESRGIAVHDNGALVVFAEGIDVPAILRNSNGGYGYDTTDVAAIKHRVDTLGADRIIYVVGTPQTLHFQLIFAVARRAGYLPDAVEAVHVGFGQVLGADGKKFSTREGTAVHLDDLLDEAETHAARPIALAALKYADLSSQLQKDYAFDAERMTATIGNTGPYLQYAHARASRILRNAADQGIEAGESVSVLTEPEEQALALQLSRFGETVAEVAENLQPHKLCTYLYETATALSVFYEQCPVLKSEGEVRASRLALCVATRKVLATGLGLLGIEAPDQM
ncbi:MAG TPA: arginine--tRNA ligase [Propionibacteriaceae bacterium]|nr:arginine--tRNA ligase [Propionibacteriaceae bacterium]HBY22125.1 arginine--tRNA ligase [Propionibacteriaceae bacterium]